MHINLQKCGEKFISGFDIVGITSCDTIATLPAGDNMDTWTPERKLVEGTAISSYKDPHLSLLELFRCNGAGLDSLLDSADTGSSIINSSLALEVLGWLDLKVQVAFVHSQK